MKLRKLLFTAVTVSLSLSPLALGADRLDPIKTTSLGVRNFGFEMFRSLQQNPKNAPVAISPMSIAEALTLATQGAEKETRSELESLFLSNSARKDGGSLSLLTYGITEIRKSLKDYAKKSNGAFEYASANSIWANSNPSVGLKFTKPFLDAAEKQYGALAQARDFAAKDTVTELNKWVSDQTQKKITSILDQLKADDVSVLLNAIYSKGKFKENFNLLQEGTYTPIGSTPKTVSYMTKQEAMNYYSDKNLEAFSFNVGAKNAEMGDQIALDILVPKNNDLAAVVKSLDGDYYREIVEKLTLRNIKLTLAAGKVAQTQAAKLKALLKDKPFELKLPFDEANAQFGLLGTVTGTGGRNIFIGEILTKTFYEVSPFGFEAAAATAVIMSREATFVRPKTWEAHKVASASIHVIRHIPTGTPLFIVTYDSPTLYTEDQIKELIEVGYKNHRALAAEVQGGQIRAEYDADSKSTVLALVSKEGKIVKVFKKLN